MNKPDSADKPSKSGLTLGSDPLEEVRHRRARADDSDKGDDDSGDSDSDSTDSDATDNKGDSGDDSRDTDGKD